MDGQTNVKSIMAKFSPSNNPAEEVHNRQVKVAGQSSLATKAAFEKFSHLGNAGLPARPSSLQKSPSFKPPLGIKPSLQDTQDIKEPKPPPLKSSPAANKFAALAQAASREVNERAGFPKPLGPKLTELPKEDSKPVFPKGIDNRVPCSTLPSKNDLKPPGPKPNFKSELQETDAKPVFQKLAGVKETFMVASQENDPKPLFPKAVLKPKLSLTPHLANNEETSNKNVFLNQASPAFLGPKQKTQSFKLPRDTEEKNTSGAESNSTPVRFPVTLKSVSNQSNLPHGLPKSYGQQNEETRPSIVKNVFRSNQEDSGLPAASAKFAPSRLATSGPLANNHNKDEKEQNLPGPKRKAIPPQFKLGPAPAKPSRPPVVDLARFRKDNKDRSNESHSMPLPSPIPPSVSATQAAPPPPPPPPASHPSTAPAPVLPPRNIKPSSSRDIQAFPQSSISSHLRISENEENYDDVDIFEGPGNTDDSLNSDGEMYEDITDVRHTSRDERKKEKGGKKKTDQEKKEQKEKDKKEQEVRKKFKLVGPIEVIHQAKACTDFKGGKNELTFKQGDSIEIIRITDNPEGKWLGRIRGAYGYIKTTMVEIDYDSLKRKPRPSISLQPKQPDSDQEVYDDVGDQDSIGSGGQSFTAVTFPPPPTSDEIYDGVDDDEGPTRSVSQGEDKSDSWSRGLLKIITGKEYPKKSVRESTTKVNVKEDNGGSPSPLAKQTGKDSGDSDVYDDVEPSDFPPPPKILNQGINTKPLSFGKNKSEERDSQKVKKMEKEEKEFRKKFKFEGDIRVLYTTTIMQAPTPKKKASKDLLVKPGDSVEVIKNVDDSKVLCRNEEGKYGYVPKSCLVDDDEEIYDDIGEDCIYDND
ncbi:FYN-binding protein 1 isoform X2 [Eublepharis macularius]|uniref:FYN-binding protein 1 n=1 Tax=Eublepharis macularius TaxID=481883 RepID=A0AA97L5Z8_EUBMA|nr:FYN-binding protein 1 isoform X2 [Eublepharis macularius]